MHRQSTWRLTKLAIVFMALPAHIHAQSTSKNDDSSIEVVEVTGTQYGLSTISPKFNDVDGPFGTGKTLFDIPRAGASISAEQIQALNIETLQDILRVVPNSYASSGFGTPSLPTLRGQLGELFQNGVRRQAGNNGFGVPLSFNSVEQIDVFKGPPPVILGSTQRNGGFVNLRSKQAPFIKPENRIQLRAGRWDRFTAQADVGYVIDEGREGVRVSVEKQDFGSFYDFDETQSENIFFAYALKPDDVSEWHLSAEYFNIDYVDNAGINRPTQALIDEGLYITGQGQRSDGSFIPGAGAVISPSGQVRLPRNRVLTHPDDVNGAQTWILHSQYKRALDDDLALRNVTYYQHLSREEIAQNSFVEIIDGATTFENRTELDVVWSPIHTTTLAANIRYNDVLGYSQFTTEADAPIDLSGPISNRVIPLTETQQARLIELRPGLFVSPGGNYDVDGDGTNDFNQSDTTNSTSWQYGLGIQHDAKWNSVWSTSIGARADYYDVEARDPIAPAGVVAGEDSISEVLYSWNASVQYKIDASTQVYATYSYNEATSNSMAGGNVLNGNNEIDPQNFATENELWEAGVKYAPANSPWYADFVVFDQTRGLRNLDGSNSGVASSGLETQVFYVADAFWMNLSYSYLDVEFDNSAAFQESFQVADAFDNSRPDIIEGTGVGSPNFAVFAPSNTRLQGIPRQVITTAGGLDITEFMSLGYSAVFTKSYPLDFLQTVYIRDQYTLNLNANYFVNDALSVRLDFNNVTNQDNWRPVFEGGFFGSTLVFPELPRHASVAATYRF